MTHISKFNFEPASTIDEYEKIFSNLNSNIIRSLDDFDKESHTEGSSLCREFNKMEYDAQKIFRGGLVFNPFGYGLASLRMDIFFDPDFVEEIERNFPPEAARCFSNRSIAVGRILEREELVKLPNGLFESFGISPRIFFNDEMWWWACVAGNCMFASPFFICLKKSCGFSWPPMPKKKG